MQLRVIARKVGAMTEKTPIAWSREEAERLRLFAASPQAVESQVQSVTARALQFLSDHANGTAFERTAIAALARWQYPKDPILAIAFQLEEWATSCDGPAEIYYEDKTVENLAG